jgi:hypothetical protein
VAYVTESLGPQLTVSDTVLCVPDRPLQQLEGRIRVRQVRRTDGSDWVLLHVQGLRN